MKSVAWMGAALTIALGGCQNSREQPTYGTEQTERSQTNQPQRTQEDTGTAREETGAYGMGETQAEPQGGVAGGGQAMQQGGQGACQQLSTCYQALQNSLCGEGETACRTQFDPANVPTDESTCRTSMSRIRESVQPYMATKSDFTMPTECNPGQ